MESQFEVIYLTRSFFLKPKNLAIPRVLNLVKHYSLTLLYLSPGLYYHFRRFCFKVLTKSSNT